MRSFPKPTSPPPAQSVRTGTPAQGVSTGPPAQGVRTGPPPEPPAQGVRTGPPPEPPAQGVRTGPCPRPQQPKQEKQKYSTSVNEIVGCSQCSHGTSEMKRKELAMS